ncbi:MAG: ornithine carbamoyltransferase [Thermoguttaceae bacterium]
MKKPRHLLTLDDVSRAELETILTLAAEIKSDVASGRRTPLLAGKTLAMIFEKQSLRTRVSFEAGMLQLGGGSLFLGADVGFGKREATCDFARVLSSMVDAIAFRAKSHASVVEMAKWSSCPIINALTDEAHPCQALADVLTLQEHFGTLRKLTLACVGDCNNVTASLVRAAAKLGFGIVLVSPKKYQFSPETIKKLCGDKSAKGFSITITDDPQNGVAGVHAIYTDVWVSMGQEAEEAKRKRAFKPYQVNAALMKLARRDAVFLHCLPAKRGQEVTDDVIDSPQSLVVQQAENRMHAQKGLLAWLLK